MLSWLRDWWYVRSLKKQRAIYRYWNGDRFLYADPYRLWREISNHPKLNMDSLDLVDKGEEPETTIAVHAVSEIFGVARWDARRQSGLTDNEILDCLLGLMDYFERLKKKLNPGPILSPPMDSESSISLEPHAEPTSCC